MSTNVAPYSGGTPQIIRGTPVDGEDVQHVLLADSAGNFVGTAPRGSSRGVVVQNPDVLVTGTMTAAGQYVSCQPDGFAGATCHVSGTWTGLLNFQTSEDGVNWFATPGLFSNGGTSSGTSDNRPVRFAAGTMGYLRIFATTLTSGTVGVQWRMGDHSSVVGISNPLPSGTNTLGNIGNVAATPAGVRLSDGGSYLTTSGGRLAVDASGVTQPVSDAGGSLTIDSLQLPSALVGDRLAVDGSGVTQPVSISGTLPVSDAGASLTVDAPLASPLHVRLTDGTNSAAITNSEPTTSSYGVVTRAIQQSTPTYWATFDRIAPAAATKYMAVLWNTTSTRVVKVRRIWRTNWQVVAAVGVLLEQELRIITARTGVGTTVVPTSLDSNDTLTAGIEASHNATGITDGGMLSRVLAVSEEAKLATTGGMEVGFAADERYQIVYEESRGSAKPITLRQNRGIAIKNTTSSTAGTVSYIFEFTDEAA